MRFADSVNSESPRWLLEKGRRDEALKSLFWLRPDRDTVEGELLEMETSMEQEKALSSGVSVWDMFKGTDLRRTLLAVGAISTQAASGAMFMIGEYFPDSYISPDHGLIPTLAYGTYFFEMAGVGSPFENSCILTGVGVVAIIINTLVITKFGRRRFFLITGLVICGFIQLAVSIVYTVAPGTKAAGKAIVALGVLYIVGYNGMIATYAWLCGGEIPSQRLRSYTFGLATSVAFLGAWLAT